jgi:hypothetical protein
MESGLDGIFVETSRFPGRHRREPGSSGTTVIGREEEKSAKEGQENRITEIRAGRETNTKGRKCGVLLVDAIRRNQRSRSVAW